MGAEHLKIFAIRCTSLTFLQTFYVMLLPKLVLSLFFKHSSYTCHTLSLDPGDAKAIKSVNMSSQVVYSVAGKIDNYKYRSTKVL